MWREHCTGCKEGPGDDATLADYALTATEGAGRLENRHHKINLKCLVDLNQSDLERAKEVTYRQGSSQAESGFDIVRSYQ